MMIRLRGCAIVLTLLLAGCGFFSRSKSQYYSLEPMGPEAAPAAAAATGVPIGIDGVELPPGIDRKEIVVRGADNRLEVRSAQQWASSLEQMVIHTLAFDLAKRLPVGMVVLPGQAKPAAMRSLYITFEDLAPTSERVLVVEARWTLTGTGQPERTGSERITLDLPSLESHQIVLGTSQALSMLADRIVAQLGRPAG